MHERLKVDYDVLLDLLEKRPSLKTLLQDKGDADAPLDYLVAVEMGLREVAAKNMHAMGKFALDTYEEWIKVPLWKKRESYIALCRMCL